MMNQDAKKIDRSQFILAAIGLAAGVVVRFSYWISMGVVGSVGAYFAFRAFAIGETISTNQQVPSNVALLGLAALAMFLFLSVAKSQQGTMSQQMAGAPQSKGLLDWTRKDTQFQADSESWNFGTIL